MKKELVQELIGSSEELFPSEEDVAHVLSFEHGIFNHREARILAGKVLEYMKKHAGVDADEAATRVMQLHSMAAF